MEKHNDILTMIAGRRRTTSKDLAYYLGIDDSEAQPVTRGLIKQTMRTLCLAGHPIGADRDGYFLIETQKELDDYVESLRGRIRGIEERIRLVQAAWAARPIH